ncbi:glycosyltransferase, partial [Porphyromonas loveana]
MNSSVPITFSIVVPVYNRPNEVRELLESLLYQTSRNFEVIIVEDGSSLRCDRVVDLFRGDFNLNYVLVPNGGPAAARNLGARMARGEYILILDSDVILPRGYIAAVQKGIEQTRADAFGGPDAAADGFTPVQKAINYAMTSFFTTGGIRGGKGVRLDKFYPRSFNLGCRRSVYESLGGFSEEMRFGEDIDFSLRLFGAGCMVRLFPEAFVFHKRRVDFRKFFRQVYNSGIARIHLQRRHPGSMKLVHILPAL